MALDKCIAAFFLVVSVAYGYTSVTYRLLPFERNMVFLPTTLPNVLAVLAGVLSLIILIMPAGKIKTDDALVFKKPHILQASTLIIAMVGYALLLRPAGFIPSTTVFLLTTGWVLGERKLHIMVPIATFSSVFIWYLVQETLGLFLRPLPGFLS